MRKYLNKSFQVLLDTKVLCWAVVISLFYLINSVPLAQAAEEQNIEERSTSGFIYQLVSMSFFPSRVFLLQEIRPGEIRQYPAESMYAERESISSSKMRVFLAAQVPVPPEAEGAYLMPTFHVTFLMQGERDSFAAMPIKKWTLEKLRSNSQSAQVLSERNNRSKHQLEEEQAKLQEREEKLTLLHGRASQIAGIDEIIDLKMELARLRGFGEEAVAERAQLQDLIEVGRKLKDPLDIDERRHELLIQLAETARVTALADRLNRRRRTAALANIQKKLAFIKETKDVDLEVLAKRASTLRLKRKQLERMLNVSSETGTAEDF